MNIKYIYSIALALTCGVAITGNAQTVKKSTKIGDGVYELVFNSKNNAVYVATTRGNAEKPTIFQLDPNSLQVTDSISLESGAFGLGINEKTQTLYGTGTRAGAVIAIDIKSKKTLATITNGQEGGHTREVLVDEGRNMIYVSDVKAGIWAINGKTNTFSHMLSGVAGATGLAIDPGKNRLYGIVKNKVLRYDLKNDAVIDSFATGGERAINLALDVKRNHLFVAHQGSANVTVLDANSGKLLQTIPAGEGALGISYSSVKDRVFVANRGAGTVTVINAADYSVVQQIQTGSLPNTVVVDPAGNAFVSNKAKGGGRPKKGETPKPSNDPDGDIVTRISL
ncbi:YncE family protein [Sphingobacterium bambusae]|uniref:YncE family protein n=1 Tax=Sphingobacterium bambusae TaxID=662858 RepID=A0ABW6BEL3_9SPHI|nr:YncE family protein [Sphingobacterium bambusae]WPL50547.1 YncE family protein [Sphingobacterium bambusae]